MISNFTICLFISLLTMLPLQKNTSESSQGKTSQAELPISPTAATDRLEDPKTSTEPKTAPIVDKVQQSIKIGDGWKRLGKNQIWINETTKKVMVRGSICLTEGPLEMFACPLQTKEHESIIAVEAKSSEIHACLVALGFEPGNPVQWQPQYKSAKGPMVQIEVRWSDNGEDKQVDAKTLVRKSGTEETMDTDWVFGGSEIFIDRVDGRRIYYADSGEMICLSNFPTAMMDVPIQSSDSADGLLFEANTDAIPPKNTQVYLIMTPRN